MSGQETHWQWDNDEQTSVVKINIDGSMSSCGVAAQEVQDYLEAGGVIQPKDSWILTGN
jgi:hypothetical protein